MRVAFVGESHAARQLASGAMARGHKVVRMHEDPAIVFVSEDTPIDENGDRDLTVIAEAARDTRMRFSGPIVLTSQVEPGFTRSLELGLFHQAETLRIGDAEDRAEHPEYIALGTPDRCPPVPELIEYYAAFRCPVFLLSLEEAEMTKISVNWFLKAQVQATNQLAKVSSLNGARWERVANVLKHDSRIGQHAYLIPGDWEASAHLKRDARTVEAFLAR